MMWWLALSAFAQDPDVSLEGELRAVGATLSDFPVDAEGTTIGQSAWLESRARINLGWQPGIARLELEGDFGNGQIAGDVWNIPGTIDERHRETYGALLAGSLAARKALVETAAGNVQLRAGLDTSHWGLGILSNDGWHQPLFGRAEFGDRVLRLRATKLPHSQGLPPRVSLLTTVAADLVVEDELAVLADNQTAGQLIFSTLWVRRDKGQYGLYAVGRYQRERAIGVTGDLPARTTRALVLDGSFDLPWAMGEDWTLHTAAEGAGILGDTDRATTYNSRDRIGVGAVGLAGHLRLAGPEERFQAHLRAGYASGDGDPDDNATHDFTFDRDFQAGIVLFDQVMGGVEAATHNQLIDPTNAGVPPDGVEATVTEGAFKRAAFLQPVLQQAVLPQLELRAGFVAAFATAPVVQPFYTYRAGGVPMNHHNKASDGRLLGTEVDWAVAFRTDPDNEDITSRPSLELQGGHGFLGAPLQGAGPNTVTHLLAVGRLNW